MNFGESKVCIKISHGADIYTYIMYTNPIQYLHIYIIGNYLLSIIFFILCIDKGFNLCYSIISSREQRTK